MDREYVIKLDEIESLIQKGEKDEALDELDGMNWRRIHNVNAVVKGAQLYEAAGHLEDSKALLTLAHERSPIGRTILYHLAMVCIRMGDFEEAHQYYDAFVEIAPHDILKYSIKYEMNKAKGADAYSLIAILEELREKEFIEKWAYELAMLYHQTAQVDKCIDLCDEISLWFGEGPYVERALELKMLYHPLDKEQEEKYRSFRGQKEDVTEIRANEKLDSGEIVPHDIAIPKVELPAERFNTVNLQAEIKRNIEEIMQATEAGEVNENMESIKELVEEIPFLQDLKEPMQVMEEKKQQQRQLGKSLQKSFNEYLEEEHDGQLSLFVPEKSETEEQIKGQMTIEEVMENWEKTKRAAEAALKEASERKLESAKAEAIKEATQIMDKLESIAPQLDAGVAPAEILKEEYLTESAEEPKEEVVETPTEIPEEEPKQKTFSIPRIVSEGKTEGIGFEIPVVIPGTEKLLKGDMKPNLQPIAKEDGVKSMKEWQPPRLDAEENEKVNLKEASKLIENINQELDRDIERLYQKATPEEKAEFLGEEKEDPDLILGMENVEKQEEEPKAEEENKPQENESENRMENETSGEIEDDSALLAAAVTAVMEEEDKTETENPSEDSEKEDRPIDLSNDETDDETEEDETEQKEVTEMERTDDQMEKEMSEGLQAMAETIVATTLEEETPKTGLTDEEKELFTYFVPIDGMEKAICRALTGAKKRLMSDEKETNGHIIIQGGRGSGKTTMATALIKVLQNDIQKPNGNIGRIDGEKLNEKDIQKIFDRVKDGCLIIENAGEMSRETTVTLSLLMENDVSRTLIILEDSRIGVERLTRMNAQFIKKFTEKIAIPIFTADELVNFGKAYALDNGCVIDEMGTLALYGRISLIQHLDRPTYITEVKDIIDEAIEKSENAKMKGLFGRFGKKHEDESGNHILMEKDFQK